MSTYILWRDSILPHSTLYEENEAGKVDYTTMSELNDLQRFGMSLRRALIKGKKRPEELRQLTEFSLIERYSDGIDWLAKTDLLRDLAAGLKAMLKQHMISTDVHSENVARLTRTGQHALFDLGYTFPTIALPQPKIPSLRKLAEL